MRFLLGTKVQLQAIQVALDKANGLRDSKGNPTPKPQWMTLPRVWSNQGPWINCYDQPGNHWPLVEGADGSLMLELAQIPWVDDNLGKTIQGVVIPQAKALVTARELTGEVAAYIDDRIVANLPSEVTADKLINRVALTPETRAVLTTAETTSTPERIKTAVDRRDAQKAAEARDLAVVLSPAPAGAVKMP